MPGWEGGSASVCPQGRRAVLSVRSGGSIEATQQAWKTAVRQANNDDGVDRLVEDTRHFMYVSRLSLDGQYKMFSEPTHRTMPYKSRFSRCHLILPPMQTPSTARDRKQPRASRLPHLATSEQAAQPHTPAPTYGPKERGRRPSCRPSRRPGNCFTKLSK